jgi:hypothetical protein
VENLLDSLYNLKHWFFAKKTDLSKGLDNFVNVFQPNYVKIFHPKLFLGVLQLFKDRFRDIKVVLNDGVVFQSQNDYFGFFPAVNQLFSVSIARMTVGQRSNLGMESAPKNLTRFFYRMQKLMLGVSGQPLNLEKVLIWIFKELSSDQVKRMVKLKPNDYKDPNNGEYLNAINDFKNSLLRLSPDAVNTVGSCTTKSFSVGKKEFSAR